MRTHLRSIILAAVLAASLSSVACGSLAAAPRILEQADLVYLGAFRMPPEAGGHSTAYGTALTHRMVGGEARFFSAAHILEGAEVYEFDDPGYAAEAPYPLATVRRHWGDVYHGLRRVESEGEPRVYGLYWDAIDSRLYWSFGDEYNATAPNNPCLGVSVLDDTHGSSEAFGPWSMGPDRGVKMCQSGVLGIPAAFAGANTGGRRLGVGFGGYFSIVTVGPASMGPALAAVDPPDPDTVKAGGDLPHTPLIGYPFHEEAYSAPFRCERDADVINDFDAWKAKNGVGYWTWTDQLQQAAVWIDLPDVRGVVFFPTLGNGRVWYQAPNLHAERGSHWIYVYDPDDLARAAQGKARQDQIQPARRWPIEYPGVGYPLGNWEEGNALLVQGVTFEPSTRRLYVMLPRQWREEDGCEDYPMVHVYEVK